MTCASTFIAIVSSFSPSSVRPAHSASAPQTATFSADDPAMPAPAGDSPRVRSVRFSARKKYASRLSNGRPWPSARSFQLGDLDRLRRCRSIRAGCLPSVRSFDLGVRTQADRGVQRLRVLVEQIQGPDVERAAGEIDSGWCRALNLLHVWARAEAERARARCGAPCRPSCRG